MKVVHLSTLDFGGAANSAYRLHKGLQLIGIDSKFIVLDKKCNDESVKVIPEGLLSELTSCLNVESYSSKRMDNAWRNWADIQLEYKNRPAGLELFTDSKTDVNLNLIKEIKEADIINLHWVAGMIDYNNLEDLFSGKKIVWTLHDMNAFTGGCHYTSGCEIFLRECSKCPQLGSDIFKDLSNITFNQKRRLFDKVNINVVTPSKWLGYEASRSKLFNKYQVEVIPYGLPINTFKPYPKNELRKELNIDVSKKLVLFGAQDVHNRRKGFYLLVNALELLPSDIKENLILGIFGNLPASINLSNKFDIVNFGSISSADTLAAIYSMADVFVLPSLEDNLPNTVLESLACGTPVVGFNIGGVPDMIEHKQTGYLAKPFEIQDLAQGIEWVLLNSTNNTRKTCREFVEKNYAPEIQANTYLNLYKSLLNKSEAINIENNKENILVATSIAPFSLEKQKLAVSSWLKCGFKVVSLNSPEEIEKIKDEFPEITFQPVKRNAKELAGKPFVYFDDVMDYLQQSNFKVCGIINSDIILNTNEQFINFINNEVDGSLIYGSRVDIVELNSHEGSFYEIGFDYFFFTRELIKLYPKSELCIGLPWWDYWMVTVPFINNVKLKKVISQAALHLWHETNYSHKYWVHFGSFFINYLIENNLLKLPKDFIPDEKDNSLISFALLSLIYQRTKHHTVTVHNAYELLSSIHEDKIPILKRLLKDINKFNSPDIQRTLEYINKGLYKEIELILVEQSQREKNNAELILNLVVLFIAGNYVKYAGLYVNQYLDLTNDYNSIIKYFFEISPDHIYPKVSAIVSTYNSEKYIKGCLEDLVKQTLYKQNKLEIIVIDSGSEQNEAAIVKEFQDKYKHINYHRTEKETIYQAWNRGIKLAQGKYVTNANADDRHAPDALEKMAKCLDDNPDYALAYANVYKTFRANDTFNSKSKKEVIKWMDFDSDLLLFGCYIGPQPLWRKSIHEKHGYFDEDLKVVGDYEFWLRICKDEKFYHLPDILGLYLYSESSAEHREHGLTHSEDAEVKREYLIKNISSKNDLERVKAKLNFIGKLPEFTDYYNNSMHLLNKREAGLLLEDNVNIFINSISDVDTENNFILIDKMLDAISMPDIFVDEAKFGEILNLLKGTLCLGKGDIEKAKESFENALNLNPQSSEACYGLGEVLLKEENNEAAKTMFEFALGYSPENIKYKNKLDMINNNNEDDLIINVNQFLNSVSALIDQKEFEIALDLLSKAQENFIELDDNIIKSDFMSLTGFTELGLGKSEYAKISFEESLQLNPNSSEACRGLAEIFLQSDMKDEAFTMFEWAVKNNPANSKAIEALNMLTGSNEMNEDSDENILQDAIKFFSDKDFTGAINYLDDLEENYEDFNNSFRSEFLSSFYNIKGFSYLALNLYKSARIEFEKALEANPNSPKACIGLGEIFFAKNNHEAARTMFEWAVKNDPSDEVAKNALDKVKEVIAE